MGRRKTLGVHRISAILGGSNQPVGPGRQLWRFCTSGLKGYKSPRGNGPGNITYDKREKRYVRSEKFKAVLQEPSADRYLVELQNEATNTLAFDSWLLSVPPVEFMPVPHRSVSVEILRAALDAIAQERSLEIYYQSMNPNRAEPTWRWISPHAFANDGFRWHICGYCHIDDTFKDFLLSRVLEMRGTGDPKKPGGNDRFWNE